MYKARQCGVVICLFSFLLTACQSNQPSQSTVSAIDGVPTIESEQISFSKPTYSVANRAYAQNMGAMLIIDTSPLTVVNTPQAIDSQILDALGEQYQDIEVSELQAFSFELVNELIVASSHCIIFGLEKDAAEDNGLISKGRSVTTIDIDMLEFSSLQCTISTPAGDHSLTVLAKMAKSADAKLNGQSDGHSIEILSAEKRNPFAPMSAQGGDWRSENNQVVVIYKNKEPMAAVSFGPTPKFWIAKPASDQEQALYGAIAYSLSAYDWKDTRWRERAAEVSF